MSGPDSTPAAVCDSALARDNTALGLLTVDTRDAAAIPHWAPFSWASTGSSAARPSALPLAFIIALRAARSQLNLQRFPVFFRRGRAGGVMLALLAGCAPLQVAPPEQRTTLVETPIPIAAPCFTEADRPVLAPDTVVDPATATTEQLAAAELANAEALRDYSRAVDALFIKCQKGTP